MLRASCEIFQKQDINQKSHAGLLCRAALGCGWQSPQIPMQGFGKLWEGFSPAQISLSHPLVMGPEILPLVNQSSELSPTLSLEL